MLDSNPPEPERAERVPVSSGRIHVYPLRGDHYTDGRPCWCMPTVDGDLVIHNDISDLS